MPERWRHTPREIKVRNRGARLRTWAIRLDRTPHHAEDELRMLADHIVWQFPWTWSAGVLGGLWLLSVLVLSSRVKSLDRLK